VEMAVRGHPFHSVGSPGFAATYQAIAARRGKQIATAAIVGKLRHPRLATC
jgi:hypothetical protein